MTEYLLFPEAEARLDAILDYTRERWGETQAISYVEGMIDRFAAIADRSATWRRLPAEFGIDGYHCRYERHHIYWRLLSGEVVGIVTILHERMQQLERVREAFEP